MCRSFLFLFFLLFFFFFFFFLVDNTILLSEDRLEEKKYLSIAFSLAEILDGVWETRGAMVRSNLECELECARERESRLFRALLFWRQMTTCVIMCVLVGGWCACRRCVLVKARLGAESVGFNRASGPVKSIAMR